MRCLVTGASGHLGSHVARRLVEDGHEVWALVRPQSDLGRLGEALPALHVLRADLADASTLRAAMERARPQVVIHAGWQGITAGERNDPRQITRNVTGSLELLQAAQEIGCGCWIGVGSQAEYGTGPQRAQTLSELVASGQTQTITAYGVSKLCLGLLARKFCELAQMRCVWFRLLATYGPGDDARHLIPSVITQLLNGERPALTGGEQQWDYLYVEDAAAAICLAAATPSAGGVFDLGSGQAHAVRGIVERIRDMIDPALPLGLGEIPYGAAQVMHLEADLKPLQAQLAWAPRTSLEEGLRRTIQWHRQQRA